MDKTIICRALTGPTASGKSELALRIAEENHWEIACMDSMQVYRKMDIGTAKASPHDRKRVKHHLLDLCEPWEKFTVSDYAEKADELIRKASDSGKEILFVGGTGLYLEAMIRGLQLGTVPADNELRKELHKLAEEPDGKLLIDRRLRKVDPVAADRFPMNDLRRRIRAIEVAETGGVRISEQVNTRKTGPYQWIAVSTRMNREELYRRINERTERMLREGLAEEVKGLLADGVSPEDQSMQAIGYKEMIPYLKGEYSLETASEEIKKGTRHYAKRQITFLKHLEEIQYVETDSGNAYEKLKEIYLKTGEKA